MIRLTFGGLTVKSLARNSSRQYVQLDREEIYKKEVKVVSHNLVSFDQRAEIALSLLERWGPVLAEPDGFDESGRQKLRCLTAPEIAAKVSNITDAVLAEFGERGWLLRLPDYGDLMQQSDVGDFLDKVAKGKTADV